VKTPQGGAAKARFDHGDVLRLGVVLEPLYRFLNGVSVKLEELRGSGTAKNDNVRDGTTNSQVLSVRKREDR
jgi:hypothetical protein